MSSILASILKNWPSNKEPDNLSFFVRVSFSRTEPQSHKDQERNPQIAPIAADYILAMRLLVGPVRVLINVAVYSPLESAGVLFVIKVLFVQIVFLCYNLVEKHTWRLNMKRMNLTLDDSTFRHLKALAALKDLTVGELIKMFVNREIQEKPEECELCLRYREPNEETVKTFEDTDKGIGLSKKMSGKRALEMFDKDFLNK